MNLYDILETVGVVFGLISVWLAAKNNVWNWPVGIANVIAMIFVFFHAKLYPDTILHVIYLFMSIYGWKNWGAISDTLAVSRWNDAEKLLVKFGIPLFTILSWTSFRIFTDAAAPLVDSLISVSSLTAMYLMSKRRLECWYIWIANDVVGIFLYTYKELYLIAGLYFVYLLICINGYKTWKKEQV
jgi:nicotinamide mononucleotide transporter